MSRPCSEKFYNDGAISVDFDLRDEVDFLRNQYMLLYRGEGAIRPWDLRELHNPWGRAATKLDSWRFLDLCQAPAILDMVSVLIGPDIVLHDSQFAPFGAAEEPVSQSMENDQYLFPVEPAAGLVVRLPFMLPDSEPAPFKFVRRSHRIRELQPDVVQLPMTVGTLILHDPGIEYKFGHSASDSTAFQYIIRYFPATSRYIRHPAHPLQQQLMERVPLVNYAKLPLWLVRGEDRAGNDFVTGFQPKPGRWIDERS